MIPVDRAGNEFLSFAPGINGWAAFHSSAQDAPERMLFVRFGTPLGTTRPEPKIVLVEVHLVLQAGAFLRSFRSLPLARLEAAVNQPAYYSTVLAVLPGPGAVMVPFPWSGPPDWMVAPPRRRPPKLTLRVPEGQPKPDSFYEQVAERFAYLATVSKRPAADLAEANGVEPKTIHGWVKEARRRGLLSPGERSRQ